RLAARLLFPWAMRKAAEKIMRDANGQPFQGNPFDGNAGPRARTYTYQWGKTTNQQQQHHDPTYTRNSTGNGESGGKVRIDYVPPKKQRGQRKVEAGEFVDYEEVKVD